MKHQPLRLEKNLRSNLIKKVDNIDGVLTCPYTGFQIQTKGYQGDGGKTWNVEHTYSQAMCPAAKYDLHHTWYADAYTNNRMERAGEVEVVQSTRGLAKWGLDRSGGRVFEPPDSHKGRMARALFYVSLVYNHDNSSSVVLYDKLLRRWDKAFPPDDAERLRNVRIAGIQGNRNPFIDDPSLIDSISPPWTLDGFE